MPLLNLVKPQQATGKVKEVYDMMLEKARVVPVPLQMLSPSPVLLGFTAQNIRYYMHHPTLSYELLAHIRMLVADACDYHYCVEFNAGGLQMVKGVSDERISATLEDPSRAALSDRDKAMLLFVLKAVKTPETVSRQDLDRLHDLDWNDQDIFEAAHHGAGMVAHGLLFKAFKMDE
jgi:alkylhydroperoxidase family enzyme